MSLLKNLPRFPMDSTTFEEGAHSFSSRAVQALMDGFRWTRQLDRLEADGVEWGLRTSFIASDGRECQSVYIYVQHRGQGHLSNDARQARLPFITSPQCDIEMEISRAQFDSWSAALAA